MKINILLKFDDTLVKVCVYLSDAPHKDEITNAFALVANIGIYTAWGPVQLMTIELYPTVVR